MRALSYLLVIAALLSPPSAAHAETQQAGINARGIVESAEISGIDEDEIGQDIRDAVHKLAGQAFDQQAADDLARRFQAEKPEWTATTRLLAGSQSDRVKVIFLVEKTNEEPGGESNVNSRYMVERVEVQGFDESRLSQSIRDAMKTLVGEKLDQDKASQIQHRIEDELRPRHYVVRRVVKGSDRQHIVVVYEVRNVRWIPFVAQPASRLIYHSRQNFTADVNVPIPLGAVNRFLVGLSDDQDQLLERFAGFNLGFESTKLGTDRLGLALRYSRYHDRWQPSTVSADPNAVYRERTTFDPTITFAFDPRVRLTAGVSLSDLQMQYPAIHNANANAAAGSFQFKNVWGKTDEDKHLLQGNYDFRAGTHGLDSDFIYTRHLVRAQYVYDHRGKNILLFGFSAGTLSGNAPLFERFSLGDTSTLRGWNKFDVAPLGGDRMVHATVRYGFGQGKVHVDLNPGPQGDYPVGFHFFYDTGAVGDHGSPIKARHSVGFGFGSGDSSNFFIQVAFPIRSSHVVPALMMGVRF